MSSPYSRVAVQRGISHFLLGRGLAGFAGFFVVIMLARSMTIIEYAGFTAITGMIAFAGVLSGLGLDRVIARYIPEGRTSRTVEELKRFIKNLSVVRGIISSLICLILASLWSEIVLFFKDIHVNQFPFVLLIFILSEAFFQHFTAIFQSLMLQKTLTRIMMVQWLGRVIMLVLLLQDGRSLSMIDALWIMAIPELAGVGVFVWSLRQYFHQLKQTEQSHTETTQHAASWPNWLQLVRMAGDNYGFNLLAAPPQGYFMKMLASAILPSHLVAAYGFFISIAERARQYIPLQFLYNLVEPYIMGKYLSDGDFTRLKTRAQWLYKGNLLVLVPVIIWLALSGNTMVSMLTADKYQEEVWILLLIMVQMTVGSHVIVLQLLLNAIHRSKFLIDGSTYGLVAMALFLALFLVWEPKLLFISPLVFSLVCNMRIIYQLNNNGYPYILPLRLLAGITLSGVSAYLGGVLFTGFFGHLGFDDVSILWLNGILIGMVFTVGLFVTQSIHRDEINLLKAMLGKKSSE